MLKATDKALREHASSDEATRYARRHVHEAVSAPGASFGAAWRKQWPVSDACTAICAVGVADFTDEHTSGRGAKWNATRAKVRPDFR